MDFLKGVLKNVHIKTLSTLKSQLDTDNKWKVIGREVEIHTVDFRFNEAADKDIINHIKKHNDWHIPRDYETFLLQHNGANLFELYLGDTNVVEDLSNWICS